MAETQPSKIRTIGRFRTLAIDVGGTHLKATVVDDGGHFLAEPVRVNTPVGSSPRAFVKALAKLVAPLKDYDRVSVGFPGAIKNGHVLTAPNLGNKRWAGFELEAALNKVLGKPVRLANDADIQGLAVISGKGLEMIITLGTGFGTGMYVDGRLARVTQVVTPRVTRRAKGEKTAGHDPGNAASIASAYSVVSQLAAATQPPVAAPMTAGAASRSAMRLSSPGGPGARGSSALGGSTNTLTTSWRMVS